MPTPDLDAFLANEGGDAPSPKAQQSLVQKQALVPSAGSGSQIDLDAFLKANGVDTTPQQGAIQDGATGAKAASYAESVGRAAQTGAGSSLQPTLSAGLEAGLGAADSYMSGSNSFGDQGMFGGIQNFVQNFQRAKQTQEQQVQQAQAANPKPFAVTQFITSIPRFIAENEYLGPAGTGALESASNTYSKGGSLSEIATSGAEGGVVGGALGKSMDLIGSGLSGINGTDRALQLVGKSMGPDAQATVSNLLSSTVAKKAVDGAASLAALATGGGAVDMLLRQPDSWDKAISDFKEGATIGGALALTKAVAVPMFKWGAGIVAKAEQTAAAQEIENQKTNIGNLETSLGLKNEDLNTSLQNKSDLQTDIQQKQALLDTAQLQKSKLEGVLSNEEQISNRVGSLPKFIDNVLDKHLNGDPANPTGTSIGERIGQKIQSFGDQPVGTGNTLSKAYKAVDAVQAFTSDAKSAKEQVRSLIENFEDQNTITRTNVDPITGIKSGENSATISAQDLWTAKKQIQDIIYNKDFVAASRGTGLRKVAIDFERNLRESLNNLDPSGELSKLNDAYSNGQQARIAFDEEGNINYFLSKAKNPTDPKLVPKTQELETPFMDSDSLKQSGIKYGGLKPETASDPIIGNQIKAVKGTIDSEASAAMSDYNTLLTAKKTYPKLQMEIDRVSSQLEDAAAKQRLSDLSINKAKLTVDQGSQQLEQANQNLQSLQSPDFNIPLPGIGSLKSKAAFARSIGNAASQDSIIQGLGKGLGYANKIGIQSIAAPRMAVKLTDQKR